MSRQTAAQTCSPSSTPSAGSSTKPATTDPTIPPQVLAAARSPAPRPPRPPSGNSRRHSGNGAPISKAGSPMTASGPQNTPPTVTSHCSTLITRRTPTYPSNSPSMSSIWRGEIAMPRQSTTSRITSAAPARAGAAIPPSARWPPPRPPAPAGTR